MLPGDVIVTGKPGGVDAKRTPPLFVKAGDVVEVSQIGVRRNPVVNELAHGDSVGSERFEPIPHHRAFQPWWLANDDPTEPSFRIGFGAESSPQIVLSATEQMMRRSA